MAKNNLKLSIALNRVIEPLVRENFKLCKVENEDDFLLYLKDSDCESDFYFGIVSEKIQGSSHLVTFTSKPTSSNDTKPSTQAYTLEGFNNVFKNWLSNLAYYQEESILNDPILTGYRKEFYNDFNIIDDDADYVSFSYQQQILLDAFLENVINNINEVQDSINTELVDEIIIEATNLRNEITTETKNGFIHRLSRIFAKARKGGLKISKFLFKELGKEIISTSAKSLFDFAINHTGEIIKYLHS